jgi:endonuclease/exonuclease/phosphatase family metal-dependent hydrolase
MNVHHAASCIDDLANHCAVTQRADLLMRKLTEAQCPEVVALQEVAPWWVQQLRQRVPTICNGRYELVFPAPVRADATDTEAILTRLKYKGAKRMALVGPERTALAVRVIDPGYNKPVDIVVTHTGVGADDFGNGGKTCRDAGYVCPPPCDPAGSAFVCQLQQIRTLRPALAADAPAPQARIIAGDLNLVWSATPLNVLRDAGYRDTWRMAGNAECDGSTGINCTSGRVDFLLSALKDPNAKTNVRVDYVLAKSAGCHVTTKNTKLFAGTPTVGGPGGLAWLSDHNGVDAMLRCG